MPLHPPGDSRNPVAPADQAASTAPAENEEVTR
jgi:hypothetical protein